MRKPSTLALLLLATCALGSDQPSNHNWLNGKVIDEKRARYLAMIYHSGYSSTNTNGSVMATGQSTTVGDNTTTDINGEYSGRSSTSSSGADRPLYRVYENAVIEGNEMVYVTQERIRWRWSKPAHLTVNGPVKYYVDGRKLHLLDDDEKEHVVEIVEQIKKEPPAQAQTASTPAESAERPAAPGQAQLHVSSTPDGADIEIDGNYVGSTPSTVGVASGQHRISVKKTGFKPWEREISVSSGQVNVNAALEPEN